MDWLDVGILVVALGAAVHGARVGAAVQLVSFAGFLAGLLLGTVVLVVVEPRVHGQVAKTVVALLVLIVPATVLAGVFRQGGFRLWRVLRRARFGLVDALLGAGIAVSGTLLVCWLLASLLLNGGSPSLSRQIEGSSILRGVQDVMPPVPDAFAAVERYLSTSGFPQVFVNALPQPLAPVSLATQAQVQAAVTAAKASTVKVIAIGCGVEQEGSGFSVAPGLFVTNAHVIAGTHDIAVLAPSGREATAVPVAFGPRFDLAVLRARLQVPVLSVDPGFITRGTSAVVLGYPGGGPFDARRAGVMSRFEAQGRDIYDESLTDRTVYELQAVVRPGNSGGPLVTPSGEVVGVVFSRSASNPDIGYALASPGVVSRVAAAERSMRPVSTEACTGA